MKISKLTIAALLTMGLVLTGCNNKKSQSESGASSQTSSGSSSSEAAKAPQRITIQRVNTVVVGDTLDLEQLVEVIYNDGSKDKNFTLEVPAASSELVTLEGKRVTFVKEGKPSIKVNAGEKSATFETNAVSQLKKNAQEHFADVVNNFAVSYTTDGTNFLLRKLHRPNYTYKPKFSPDGGLTTGEGFLKFASGRGYEFSIASGVITVGDQVEFDNYFTNMDLDLALSETVTLQDELGNDYLHLSSSVPSAWAEYGYYSHVHFLIYTMTGLSFSDPYDSGDPAAGTQYYRWESINVHLETIESEEVYLFDCTAAKYEVAEHEDPEYAGEDDQIVEDTEEYQLSLVFDPLGEEEVAFPALEAFIADPENEPISKDFSKVQTFVGSKLDGTPHNYTIRAESAFNAYASNGSFMREDASYTETYLVNEDVYDINVVGGATGAYGAYWGPEDASSARGYAVKEDVAYSYERDGITNPATATSQTSIYGSAIKSITFASLSNASLWSEFYVSAVQLDEANHEETYVLNPSRSVPFIRQMLNCSDAGYYFLTDLTNYWSGREDEFIGYADYVAITLLLDDANTEIEGLVFEYSGILANFGSTVGLVYFEQEVEFTGFGSTAAVDISDITFPA